MSSRLAGVDVGSILISHCCGCSCDQKVATLVQPSAAMQPGDTLVRAVVTMEKSGARQLGVIDPADSNRLIGLVTMSDIVRAHARAVIDADDVEAREVLN